MTSPSSGTSPGTSPRTSPRTSPVLRLGSALTALALLGTLVALGGPAARAGTGVGPASAAPVAGATDAAARRARDPRRRRALFVDPQATAAGQGPAYAAIGRRPQARWFSNESYSVRRVTAAARRYVTRANRAARTPVLVVYAIPDRDCGQHSAGGLPGATAYRRWVAAFARGVRGGRALVVLEPDAIPFYEREGCGNGASRLDLIRYAARTLSRAGAWVYLDAGHSDWTPYADRAALLKRAGIGYARGFSTNVSNFRPLAAERAYAAVLLRGLRELGVRGKRYVVDTSRNGAAQPVSGDAINPTWARLGARPRPVFRGGLDFTLWVKNPGESDGTANGGPAAGRWCDLLADRLLARPESAGC